MIYGPSRFPASETLTAGSPPDTLLAGVDLLTVDAETVALAASSLVLADAITLATTQYLVRLAAYLDGDGTATADQTLRGVIYRNGKLAAAGNEVTVLEGQAPGWVSLRFPTAGLELPSGAYQIGVHAGPADNGSNFYIDDIAGGHTVYSGVPYASGPPASLPAGGSADPAPPLFFMEVLNPVRVASDVTDDYLAALPFDVAQRVFRAGGTIPKTRTPALAGWYGTTFDAANGANAIARVDGPLAGFVGERLLVSQRGPAASRVVAVYVHDQRAFPDELADEDLLLSGRAFLALADLALDALEVNVEVLA